MKHMTPEPLPEDDKVFRAFVAIPMSDEVIESLSDAQNELRRTETRVSWVAPERLHLTLVFLGDIFSRQARILADALDTAAAEIPPFALRAHGIGFFGSPRSPRVIWAGLDAPAPLMTLHAAMTEAARGMGLKVEERPFRPHLTLGRVRYSRDIDRLLTVVRQHEGTDFGVSPVNRAALVRSRLLPDAPHYTLLHESTLKGV